MEYQIVQCEDGDEFWPYISEHSPETVRWIKERKDPGGYYCFAAADENKKFLGLSVIDIGAMAFGPLAEKTIGFFEEVQVFEQFRRKGIGTALMRAALSLAWQYGAEHVRWVVDYENAGGIALSQKAGAAFIPEEDPDSEEPERYYTVVVVNPKLTNLTEP
jgi:GNAT superfamily N-acetyltransferase